MSNEDKRFETFSDLTGDVGYSNIPSAYSLRPAQNNTYYELNNEELEGLSLNLEDIQTVDLLHVAPHKRLIRIRVLDKYYVLLDNKEPTKEYRCYELLRRYDVPTLPVYAMAETEEWSALLMEDLHLSDVWRLASPRDASDYTAGEALGVWYRQLHDKGVDILKDDAAAILEREDDELTAETIQWTAEKLELSQYSVFQTAAEYIGSIKKKALSFSETILYNDFSYENMAVSNDLTQAVMFDYHLMGRGYRYSDVRNVLSGLKGAGIDGFLENYGAFDEEEKVVDDVLAPLYSMLVAAQRPTLPKWVKPTIKEVKQGIFEEKLKLLLQNL